MIKTQPENQPLSTLAALLTASLCVAFGANAVATKISLVGFNGFFAAALRFAIGSLAISLWALVTGRSFAFQKKQLVHIFVICASFTIQMSLVFAGIDKSNASHAALLTNVQPFLVLFLAHFFIPGDRMNLKKLVGITLGFIGVTCVLLEDAGVTDSFRLGDSLMLASVVLWAGSTIYIKRIIAEFEAFHIVFYPMVFCIPFLLVGGLISEDPMVREVDRSVVMALLYQGLIGAGFGYVAWTSLLKKHGAVALHSYIFLVPIAGVMLAGVMLGEPVGTLKMLLALVFIVTGILIVHVRFRKVSPR